MKGSSKGQRTWMRHVLSRERRGYGGVLGDVTYQHQYPVLASGRVRKHGKPKTPRQMRRRFSTYTWRR